MDERDSSGRRVEPLTVSQIVFRVVFGIAVAGILATGWLIWRAHNTYKDGFNGAVEPPLRVQSAAERGIPSTDSTAESSDPETVKLLATQGDAIREAVMWWLVRQADLCAFGEDVTAYFLKFEGDVDPPEEFLKRFEHHEPSILAGSEADLSEMVDVGDPRTGKFGLLLNIDSIKRISDTEVEVEVGYWRCDISFGGWKLRCTLRDGRWHVVMTDDAGGWAAVRRDFGAKGGVRK